MAGGRQSEKLMVLECHENRDRLEGERWSETENENQVPLTSEARARVRWLPG